MTSLIRSAPRSPRPSHSWSRVCTGSGGLRASVFTSLRAGPHLRSCLNAPSLHQRYLPSHLSICGPPRARASDGKTQRSSCKTLTLEAMFKKASAKLRKWENQERNRTVANTLHQMSHVAETEPLQRTLQGCKQSFLSWKNKMSWEIRSSGVFQVFSGVFYGISFH